MLYGDLDKKSETQCGVSASVSPCFPSPLCRADFYFYSVLRTRILLLLSVYKTTFHQVKASDTLIWVSHLTFLHFLFPKQLFILFCCFTLYFYHLHTHNQCQLFLSLTNHLTQPFIIKSTNKGIYFCSSLQWSF